MRFYELGQGHSRAPKISKKKAKCRTARTDRATGAHDRACLSGTGNHSFSVILLLGTFSNSFFDLKLSKTHLNYHSNLVLPFTRNLSINPFDHSLFSTLIKFQGFLFLRDYPRMLISQPQFYFLRQQHYEQSQQHYCSSQYQSSLQPQNNKFNPIDEEILPLTSISSKSTSWLGLFATSLLFLLCFSPFSFHIQQKKKKKN